MKRPKMKKRKGYWLVYREREKCYKCFDLERAEFCFTLLTNEMRREIEKRKSEKGGKIK